MFVPRKFINIEKYELYLSTTCKQCNVAQCAADDMNLTTNEIYSITLNNSRRIIVHYFIAVFFGVFRNPNINTKFRQHPIEYKLYD